MHRQLYKMAGDYGTPENYKPLQLSKHKARDDRGRTAETRLYRCLLSIYSHCLGQIIYVLHLQNGAVTELSSQQMMHCR